MPRPWRRPVSKRGARRWRGSSPLHREGDVAAVLAKLEGAFGADEALLPVHDARARRQCETDGRRQAAREELPAPGPIDWQPLLGLRQRDDLRDEPQPAVEHFA